MVRGLSFIIILFSVFATHAQDICGSISDVDIPLAQLSDTDTHINICTDQKKRLLRSTPAANSLLDSGDWFKIKVDTSGVYKLTLSDLRHIGIAEPENVRIYSYGGKQLPFINSESDFDDLNEIPTLKFWNDDGSLDKIVFYAQGPVTLSYDAVNNMLMHKKHDYSDFIYLFLTSDLGEGLRIESVNKNELTPDTTTSVSDSYQYVENDRYTLIPSGRRWYDSRLTTNGHDSVPFSFGELADGEPVRCYFAGAGRKSTAANARFQFSYLREVIATIDIRRPYANYVYAEYVKKIFTFTPNSSHFYLGYSFVSNNQVSEGYIDKIGVMARSKLKYSNKRQLHFRDVRTRNYDNVKYCISLNNGNPTILDITNPVSPKKVETQTDNDTMWFVAQGNDTVREFVAFESDNLLSPITSGSDVGKVENQNLHGRRTPMLAIVTHPDFWDAANDLAEMHREQDGMQVEVVTPEQIYNEFSGGTPDVSAIRNYARMMYQRNEGFRYLLLLGDGTYDNKNILGSGGSHVFTYQSESGEAQDASYVSDDFFGLLDYGEGELSGHLDIGVGRLPANTATEAQQMVDKIKRYTSMRDIGNWRNNMTMISDDADNVSDAEFVKDAELMCQTVNEMSPEYNIRKIYLDAYGRVSGSSGDTYPMATDAIKKELEKGSVIMTYIGHGSAHKLAHETVLQVSDVKALRNIDRLPLFITASCEIGRYDDHIQTSLGEHLLLNPNGGAVAVFASSRVAYNNPNYQLCNNVFKQGTSADMRLGDILRHAKNATGDKNEVNKRNFALLGDPAIRLVHPYNNRVRVTRINGKYVLSDTSNIINAVDTVRVEGYVCDNDGNRIDADGILYSTVFDKPATLATRGNDPGAPIVDFDVYNNILFQGKSTVSKGAFSFNFIVPKDINYSLGLGRISLYALTDTADFTGYSNRIMIGGTPENAEISDFDGPEVKLFVNDTFFIDGGITSNNPTVIARIWDQSGINTTGNGIGHNITAMIDNDPTTMITLDDLYEGDIDSYTSGTIRFSLNGLDEGWHTLTFKVWDIYNNSSESEIEFKVADESVSELNSVRCYPNPTAGGIWFVADHNQTDSNVEITIKISDTQGRLIAHLTAKQEPQEHQPIFWDTCSGGKPVENGLYIYTIEIRSANGRSAKSGKMIVARQ